MYNHTLYAYIIDPVVSSPPLISSTSVTSFTDNIMSTAPIFSDLYIVSTHFMSPTPPSKLYWQMHLHIQSNYHYVLLPSFVLIFYIEPTVRSLSFVISNTFVISSSRSSFVEVVLAQQLKQFHLIMPHIFLYTRQISL